MSWPLWTVVRFLFNISGLHLGANTYQQFLGLLYFLSKFLNFSYAIVWEYKLLTMVVSFVYSNGLPNWTLASYSFLMVSRIGSRSPSSPWSLSPSPQRSWICCLIVCWSGILTTSSGCSLSLMPYGLVVSSSSEISLTLCLFYDWGRLWHSTYVLALFLLISLSTLSYLCLLLLSIKDPTKSVTLLICFSMVSDLVFIVWNLSSWPSFWFSSCWASAVVISVTFLFNVT